MKIHSLFFAAALLMAGCATHQTLTLSHTVNVPKEFRAGNFSQEHPGYSEGNCAVERYVNAYERGWITAVERYANDINLDDPSTLPWSGWVEETEGGSTGYADARDRIQMLIQVYGKEKVSSYLQQFRPEFPREE